MSHKGMISFAGCLLIGAAIYPQFNPSLMMAGIALWLSINCTDPLEPKP